MSFCFPLVLLPSDRSDSIFNLDYIYYDTSDGLLFMHLLDLFNEILVGMHTLGAVYAITCEHKLPLHTHIHALKHTKTCSLHIASLSCTLSFIPLHLAFVTKWCQSASTHPVLRRYQLNSKWKSSSPRSSSRDKILHAVCRHTALFSINIMEYSFYKCNENPLWPQNQLKRGDNPLQEAALSAHRFSPLLKHVLIMSSCL